jgi:large subunit ribosomal protein L10
MDKKTKEKTVKDIKDRFEKSKVTILTDYKGLTMAQMSGLRRKLRPLEAEYKVYKNTLILRAVKDKEYSGIDSLLAGSTAILFGYGDQVLPAKILAQFMKESEKLSIKGGVLDGKLIDTKTISMLSKLPSKEVLIAKVLGGMKAPITNLVFDLKGIINKFVYALAAVRDKKGKA